MIQGFLFLVFRFCLMLDMFVQEHSWTVGQKAVCCLAYAPLTSVFCLGCSLRLKHKSLEHETCSVSAILVYDLSPLTREFLCWIYKLMNSSRAAPYRPLVFLGPSTFYAMPLFMIDNYAALIQNCRNRFGLFTFNFYMQFLYILNQLISGCFWISCRMESNQAASSMDVDTVPSEVKLLPPKPKFEPLVAKA